MSGFYIQVKSQINKDYKYFGLKEKISFYATRVLMGAMACILIIDILHSEKINFQLLLLVSLFVIILYYISEKDKNKHQDYRGNAVNNLINKMKINIEIVNKLIEEIEKYNKSIKTFGTWIAGLSATFIVLFTTLGFNFLMKTLDMFRETASTSELLEEYNNFAKYMGGNAVSTLFDLSFALLIIFGSIIIIIYSLFSSFTFIKGQVLLFLFDVQYVLLSDSAQKNSNKNTESLIENTKRDRFITYF